MEETETPQQMQQEFNDPKDALPSEGIPYRQIQLEVPGIRLSLISPDLNSLELSEHAVQIVRAIKKIRTEDEKAPAIVD